MRVLFVTQYFPPETGAAPARAWHLARGLKRAGHEVRVVTGLPNHPAGVIQAEYAGVRRRTETRDGIAVERVWLHATPRKTAWTRLANHLSFAASALPVALGGPRPDVVFATTPPLFHAYTAWLASVRFRIPFVMDCRDDWPSAAIELGELKPGAIATALDNLTRFVQRRAARVVAVHPGTRKKLEERGLDAGRLAVITNGADTEMFSPGPAPNGGGPRTVLYAGTHGLAHGMEVVMTAAERLRDRADVRFLFVGDGVAKPALERRAREQGLARVEFMPSQPVERLVDIIRAAEVCVVTTKGADFLHDVVPVKMYDYLACGRPVVAAVAGEGAGVIERSGGGVVVEPENADALTGAIVELLDDPARREALSRTGPAFVEAHYSRRAAGDQLARLLEDVHRRATGRPVRPVPGRVYGAVRRFVDVVAAAVLIVVLSPILLAVAVAVRLDTPGPALFRQRRIGRGSAEFTILKFRTMRVGTPDLASHLVGPGSDRVTRVGRFLRRTSIDELPQLWNVLVGDMTLIGPRPALFNQDDLIAMRQEAGVDALAPGVTGWAQVNGRDDIPLAKKVALDRHYLDHVSPALDAWICVRTFVILFSDRGVY